MRSKKGNKRKKRSYILSMWIHVVFIAFLAFPFLKQDQSHDVIYQGLMVQFTPDETIINTKTKKRKNKVNPVKKAAETKVLKPKQESKPTKAKVKKEESKSKTTPKKTKASKSELSHTDTNTLTEKRRDYLVKTIQKSEQEQRILDEEKKLKAAKEEEAKKAKHEQMRNAFSHLLKNASNETPPSNTNLDLSDESLSPSESPSEIRGAEAISNRKVVFIPKIKDSSQKEGRVVVKICVGPSGKVISARYTQKGSTTTDSYLTNLAVKNAKLYRFSPNASPKQCGIVNIDFQVQ